MDTPNNTPDNRPILSGWRTPAFAVYKWLVVIPVLGISTLIFGTLIVVFSFPGLPELASRVFGTSWARLNLAVSPVLLPGDIAVFSVPVVFASKVP